MEMFTKLPLPGSYTKHISYLDFDYFNELTKMPQVQDILENKTFKYKRPIFVNMVREPINRVISWYYYVRAPWYFVERKRAFPDLPLPNPNWLRKVRPSNPVFEKFF